MLKIKNLSLTSMINSHDTQPNITSKSNQIFLAPKMNFRSCIICSQSLSTVHEKDVLVIIPA